MRKIGAFVATLMAMCLAGSAQAVQTETEITGTMSKAENTCVSPVQFFQFDHFQMCSYSGGVDIASVVSSAPSLDFHNWMGPLDSGGYYPKDFLQDPGTDGGFGGSTPGDGKIALPLTGTMTIDDFGTPQGDDDRVSGTLIFGPGERAVAGSGGNVVERFDGITHTIPATVVSSATERVDGTGAPIGGFVYVIGSQGFPLLLTSAAGDFPSEEPSISTDSTAPPDFNAWADFNGGNITPATLPPYAKPPSGGLIPHTVEIVSYAPGAAGGSNVEPNIGVATTAVVTGLTCEAGDADSDPGIDDDGDPINDCDPDPTIGAGASWTVSGAEFDNLILRVTTNANNRVLSADAFYTLEYKIESLNLNDGNPGSWVGGTLSMAGATGAQDDQAKTPPNTPVNIDILANDVGFTDDVTITIPSVPANGTVTVNGGPTGPQADIDVTYIPSPGYEGEDEFQYTIVDADSATATVSVRVKVTEVIAPDASVVTAEGQSVSVNVTALPGARLGNTPATVTVVAQPSSGTTTVVGTVITYTQSLYPDSDAYDYRIVDAHGKSDTGSINVTISPQLEPKANDDSATAVQDSSVNIDVLANDIAGSGALADHIITIVPKFIVDPDDPDDPNDGRAAVSGDAVVEADNTVTYTPDPGVSGVHTFQYTLTDVGGTQGPDESERATVTVTVEKGELVIQLPSDGSSTVGPWSLVLLAVVMWLRRRNQPVSG